MQENERLAKLEIIVEQLAKLQGKHDNCLYGPKGDTGIIKDVNYLRAFSNITLAVLAGGGFAEVLHILRIL